MLSEKVSGVSIRQAGFILFLGIGLTVSLCAQPTRHPATTELAFFGGGVFRVETHPAIGVMQVQT